MKRLVIAIDIDDVLADSTEALRRSVNSRLNIDISKEAYRAKHDYWGYYESVWQQHEATKNMSYSDFYAELAVDQSDIPLLPGAEFAITKLTEKYEIVFITARDDTLMPATLRWFKQNLPNLSFKIHFTNHLIKEKRMTKGEICKQIGVGYLIDDNVEHCRSALENDVKAVLFGEYGWQYTVKPGELHHCKDWRAVLEFFHAA